MNGGTPFAAMTSSPGAVPPGVTDDLEGWIEAVLGAEAGGEGAEVAAWILEDAGSAAEVTGAGPEGAGVPGELPMQATVPAGAGVPGEVGPEAAVGLEDAGEGMQAIVPTPQKRTLAAAPAEELPFMTPKKVQPKLARFFSPSPRDADMEFVQVQAVNSKWTRMEHRTRGAEREAEVKSLNKDLRRLMDEMLHRFGVEIPFEFQ